MGCALLFFVGNASVGEHTYRFKAVERTPMVRKYHNPGCRRMDLFLLPGHECGGRTTVTQQTKDVHRGDGLANRTSSVLILTCSR
jgi:hypothetical protein